MVLPSGTNPLKFLSLALMARNALTLTCFGNTASHYLHSLAPWGAVWKYSPPPDMSQVLLFPWNAASLHTFLFKFLCLDLISRLGAGRPWGASLKVNMKECKMVPGRGRKRCYSDFIWVCSKHFIFRLSFNISSPHHF